MRKIIENENNATEHYELYKKLSEDVELETVSLFKNEDNRRFCAFFVLSLYAYVDNYCQNLINLLLKKKHFKMYLAEKINEDRKKPIINLDGLEKRGSSNRILRAFPTNPSFKIDKLLEYFSLERKFQHFLETRNLDEFRKLFKGFIKIRNKLAHTKPILSLETINLSKTVSIHVKDYSNKIIDMQLKAKQELQKEETAFLDNYWEFIFNWFNSLVFPLSTAFVFIKTVTVYLSIIDQIFGEIIRFNKGLR